MTTLIKIVGDPKKLKGKPLIQAFSGSGAIGTILSSFLTKSKKMEEIAIVHTDAIPPVAIVKNGKIAHPIRIFTSSELSLMSCEVPIPYKELSELLDRLIEFYVENEVSDIIPVGGLPVLNDPGAESRSYVIAFDEANLARLEERGLELLDEGIIYGSIVQTLELCESKGIKGCYSLISECDPNVASYDSTRNIMYSISKIFDIEFDYNEFEDIIEALKQKIRENSRYLEEDTINKTRESHL